MEGIFALALWARKSLPGGLLLIRLGMEGKGDLGVPSRGPVNRNRMEKTTGVCEYQEFLSSDRFRISPRDQSARFSKRGSSTAAGFLTED